VHPQRERRGTERHRCLPQAKISMIRSCRSRRSIPIRLLPSTAMIRRPTKGRSCSAARWSDGPSMNTDSSSNIRAHSRAQRERPAVLARRRILFPRHTHDATAVVHRRCAAILTAFACGGGQTGNPSGLYVVYRDGKGGYIDRKGTVKNRVPIRQGLYVHRTSGARESGRSVRLTSTSRARS
jgi:hypothetical protein